MERTFLLMVLLCGGGCGGDVGSDQMAQAVAIVNHPDATAPLRIAVTSSAHAQRLPDVLSPTPPKNFRWLMITVGASKAGLVFTSQGHTADLSTSTSETTFEHSYPDACDPRTNDFSTCWFIERLSAGAPGVSGTVDLSGTPSQVTASIDVLFEGDSLRYGEPALYYKHQTISGFVASIVTRTPR